MVNRRTTCPGSITVIAEKPGGSVVLWLMVVGFAGYALDPSSVGVAEFEETPSFGVGDKITGVFRDQSGTTVVGIVTVRDLLNAVESRQSVTS